MLYKLTDEQVKNLNAFLDRCEMKGRTETIAMYEIILALASPIKEKKEEDDAEKE